MDRRSLLTWALGLGACDTSRPQSTPVRARSKRIGALIFDGPEAWVDFSLELRDELAALGWVEGKNLELEWRYANGDPALLRAHAKALVASVPDALVARGTPATQALQQATRSIPILTGVGDPIGAGFAKSYATPGGNVTGISWAAVESSEKQVELLRTLAPRLAMLVVLVQADRSPFVSELTSPVSAASRTAGMAMRTALVATEADVQRALANDRGRGEIGALIYGLGHRVDPRAVADIAVSAGVPTMFEYSFYVDAGGLASYRLNWQNQTRRAAAQIDKVLQGESPARIPFELPTLAEFFLNRKTAWLLGLQIPQSLLMRATTVVE